MSQGKKVLLLGCGLCPPPMIKYFSDHDITTVVGARNLEKAQKVLDAIEGLKNTTLAEVDSGASEEKLDEVLKPLIDDADVVLSLLPATEHFKIAKLAVKYKTHFCTASYTSKDIESLADEAKAADILLFNECGVDPGLDHMSAMEVFDKVKEEGGKVKAFYSLCGGLPHPDDNNNEWGYKCSWAPRGVLTASTNTAKFHDRKVLKEHKGLELFSKEVYRQETIDGHDYEWYPNRDSTIYNEIYGLEHCDTLIRGTYRNKGWCDTLSGVSGLNLLSQDKDDFKGVSFLEFTAGRLEMKEPEKATVETVKAELGKKLEKDEAAEVIISKLEWLGLLDAETKVDEKVNTSLDAVCQLFQEKCVFAEGERDMLLMKHTFEIEFSPENREERECLLLDYGLQDKGNKLYSSMARTVSLPLACAVRALLDGRIKERGLVRCPTSKPMYELILREMEELNVKFEHKTLAPHFWLRHEVKPGEERVILAPADAKKLLDAGFRVTVEKSTTRCFKDEEYSSVGCTLAETGSWVDSPSPTIILGLKELPEDDSELRHRHVYFAHCYKKQTGWDGLMRRFMNGGGLLWDLEFLVDENGRRVAAFGRAAGLVGMAVGLLTWAKQNAKEPSTLDALSSWESVDAAIEQIKAAIAETGKAPGAHVLGAKGRSGSGAVWFAQQCDVKVVEWDLAETKDKKAPFPSLLESDVLVNCMYLPPGAAPLDAYITKESLNSNDRKLSVFVDVSCDTSNPGNGFPWANVATTLDKPSRRLVEEQKEMLPFDVISIDHLPSLVPKSSSEEYSGAIVQHILDMGKDVNTPVFKRAAEKYTETKEVTPAAKESCMSSCSIS